VKPRTILGMALAIALLVPSAGVIAHPGHRDVHQHEADFAPYKQHGPESGHLPPSSANVNLIGELEPTDEFGPIVEGQIADLSVYKDYAYLNSWSEPTCTKGGVYVVDIRNPRKPKELDFIPALPGNYHGEGAHVISVDTKSFKGDLLAVNNEFCTDTPTVGGGFDLYNVTDPNNPKVLVQGAGDRGGEGQMSGGDGFANDYHSVFLWEDDGKIYLVGTDNIELHDVDIWNVTDPRRPKPVREYDMVEEFPQILEEPAPNGNNVFNHDMIVKVIDGRDVLLDSYWDGGYLLIDIENPAKAGYIGDVDFNDSVKTLGLVNNNPQEGNAHQAEFSHNNKYFLAADEDFNPYRADKFLVDGQERDAAEVGGGLSAASLPDQTLSGPVVYGGYGCPADPNAIPNANTDPRYSRAALGLSEDDERILVLQRGPSGDPSAPYEACFPGEKTDLAYDAGWDAVLLVNRHFGSEDLDEAYCGSGGQSSDKLIVTLCTTHAVYHELFDQDAEFATYPDGPAIGDISTKRILATSKFDGWGYAHLYRTMGGKIQEIDAYAVPESLDVGHAFGFGDLSIHEFATDPGQNLAYISYYSAGVRVVEFGEGGIKEVGHYIAEGGSNFWGIETFVPSNEKAGNPEGKRLFAGSDRDHGIFIFRYRP
jgi:hypothetical protein